MWRANLFAFAVTILLFDIVIGHPLGRTGMETRNGAYIDIPPEVFNAIPANKFAEMIAATINGEFRVPLMRKPPSFNAVDINGDGGVSLMEYQISRRSVGAYDAELTKLFTLFDYNDDQEFDRVEYGTVSAVEAAQQATAPSDGRNDVYRFFDKDQSGALNLTEYRTVVSLLNRSPSGKEIPECVIDYIFEENDKDDDQLINRTEFDLKTSIELTKK